VEVTGFAHQLLEWGSVHAFEVTRMAL